MPGDFLELQGLPAPPLAGIDPEPRLHQHIEIPAIGPDVTHYLLHRLTCSGCGAVTRGHVPAGNRSSFGPRLEALVSHLTGFYRFSKRKIKATLLGCWIRFSGSPLVWVWCGIFRHGPLVPLKREWLRSMARS